MSPVVIPGESAPLATARASAGLKFQEQLAKNGMAGSIRSASLLIEVAPTDVVFQMNWRRAQPVRFTVTAKSLKGADVSEIIVVQVAYHDPSVELQSADAAGQ